MPIPQRLQRRRCKLAVVKEGDQLGQPPTSVAHISFQALGFSNGDPSLAPLQKFNHQK